MAGPIIPVRKGISAPIVTSIPDKWSKEWFRYFISYFLTTVQTALSLTGGSGVSISTAPSGATSIGLATQPGTSVLGVAGTASKSPAAIVATADGQVLQRAGGAVLFAPISAGSSSATSGTPGQDGADGADGDPGPIGPPGPPGASIQGPPGDDGFNGDDGIILGSGSSGTVPTVVAALPVTGNTVSTRSFVTDATATTFASIVAGGGANAVPVYWDGTNWRIG